MSIVHQHKIELKAEQLVIKAAMGYYRQIENIKASPTIPAYLADAARRFERAAKKLHKACAAYEAIKP